MTETQERATKFAYFLIGIALPIAGWAIWTKVDPLASFGKKGRVDKAHDVTVEDSFPASDPPSAW